MNNLRLFEILFFLINHKKTSARELAQQFDVSIRTIYRDIDALSLAGIPIVSVSGRNGGISLMEGFVLDRSLLSSQEQKDIIDALGSLEATGFIDTRPILEKLGSVFGPKEKTFAGVDYSRWGSSDNAEQEKLDTIRQAVSGRQCIDIDYISQAGKTEPRIIEPLQLYFREYAWYLYAYCRRREDYRLFRLSRITRYRIMTETFRRDSDLQAFLKRSPALAQSCVQLEFTVDAKAGARVYDLFDPAVISRGPAGSLSVSVELPDGEWLLSFLVSRGTSLKTVAPRSLHEKIIRMHRDAARTLERNDLDETKNR